MTRRAAAMVGLVVLLALGAPPTRGEEYRLERYKFEWVVADIGDVTLSVTKTEEGTRLGLYRRSGLCCFDRFTVEQAVEIGKFLASALERQTSPEPSTRPSAPEYVDACGCILEFETRYEGTFSVCFNKKGQSPYRFCLDRPGAETLRDLLLDAPDLVGFVDRKICP